MNNSKNTLEGISAENAKNDTNDIFVMVEQEIVSQKEEFFSNVNILNSLITQIEDIGQSMKSKCIILKIQSARYNIIQFKYDAEDIEKDAEHISKISEDLSQFYETMKSDIENQGDSMVNVLGNMFMDQSR